MIYCIACGRQPPVGSRFCPFCGSKLPQTRLIPKDTLINNVIDGKYKIIAKIGSGAMGSIYRAEHMELRRPVCLKVLHKHLLKTEEYIKRFQREARAVSKLDHPNCIKIYDYGHTKDELTYIAMEFVDGRDLAQILFTEYPINFKNVFHIITQVCDALEEAHSNIIVHRDIKPENIMITSKRNDPWFVKVLDFGIARIQDTTSSVEGFKTATGMVFGTPEYMSPEQIKGEEIDARADIYSLGIVLYQLLTAQLPFTGETVVEIASKHLSMTPPSLKQFNNKITPEIEEIVLKMLKKKREERFQSAVEVKEAILKLGEKISEEKEDKTFFVTTEKMDLKKMPPIVTDTEEVKPTVSLESSSFENVEETKLQEDVFEPAKKKFAQWKSSKIQLLLAFLLGCIFVAILLYLFFE